MKIVVIDGEIGAGKTTLIDLLAEYLMARDIGVACAYEPVEEWKQVNALQSMYTATEDRKSDAIYMFQTYVTPTRIQSVKEAISDYEKQHGSPPDWVILERSILTDRHVFMKMLSAQVTANHLRMYEAWWEMWFGLAKNILGIPGLEGDHFQIYLAPSLDNCDKRVKSRNREGEAAVDIDYQLALRKAHLDYMARIENDGTDLMSIQGDDANLDFRDDPHRTALAKKIVDWVTRADR